MFEVRVKPSNAAYCQLTEFSDWDSAAEFARLAGGCIGIDDIGIYDETGYMLEYYDFETNILVPNVFYI